VKTYSRVIGIESRERGVLDHPLSRMMTVRMMGEESAYFAGDPVYSPTPCAHIHPLVLEPVNRTEQR